MSESVRAIRDSQRSCLGHGVCDTVVCQLSGVRAIGGEGRDNSSGVRNGTVPGSKSTSGRSQDRKAVLHIGL